MNCDPVAKAYRWLEYLRFGRMLERCRFIMLPHLQPVSRALLIGDGDGRFLKELTERWPGAQIDSIDVSARMLQLAQRRIASERMGRAQQIRFYQADIRTARLPDANYDLIACQFLFDVFSTAELSPLIKRIAEHSNSKAQWVVSEFDLPSCGWPRIFARFWIKLMYKFFRIATGLVNQTLPEWRPLLLRAGFIPVKRVDWKQGFIVSELWQRTGTAQ